MICPNCGKTIRDGSIFCGFCGKRTEPTPAPEEVMPQEPVYEETVIPEVPFDAGAAYDGPAAPEEPAQNVYQDAYAGMQYSQPESAPQPKQKRKSVVLPWILAILFFLLLAAACVFGYIKYTALQKEKDQLSDELSQSAQSLEDSSDEIGTLKEELSKDKEALNNRIAELEEELSASEAALEALKEQYDTASLDSQTLQAIQEFCAQGYATANSFAYDVDSHIIFLNVGEKRTVKFHAEFEDAAEFRLTWEGDAASVSFTESSWEGADTTLTLYGDAPGVTTVELSNSVNSDVIHMLVVVLD